MDPDGRSYKNLLRMMMNDGLFDFIGNSDESFINFTKPFLTLVRVEKNKFKKFYKMEKIEEKEKFEFLLKIEDNIICQRFFTVKNHNPKTTRSIELYWSVEEIKDLIKKYLVLKTVYFSLNSSIICPCYAYIINII